MDHEEQKEGWLHERQDETPEVYEEMKGFYRFCLRLDCSCIILYKNSRHLLSNFINYTFYFVL